MKKFISLISVICLVCAVFSGCASSNQNNANPTENTTSLNQNSSSTAQSTSSISNSTVASTTSAVNKTQNSNATPKTTKKTAEKSKFVEKFTKTGEKIIAYFGAIGDYNTYLNDIAKIGLSIPKALKSGKYTKKTVKNGDETRLQYYSGKTLIYEEVSGFFEEIFVYYTKTASGKSIKVSYYHADNKVYAVLMNANDFSFHFGNFNSKSPYGAENITISISKKNKNDLSETLNYCTDKNKIITLETAKYYSSNDFREYSSWYDNGKIGEFDQILYSVCTSSVSTNVIDQVRNYSKYTLLGNHKLSYKTKSNKKQWYLTSDFYILFANKEDAKAFVKKNSLSEATIKQDYLAPDDDDDTCYVLYKNVTLPFADSFKLNSDGSFETLAYSEFNDNTFAHISVNSSNEITELSYDNSILSCY